MLRPPERRTSPRMAPRARNSDRSGQLITNTTDSRASSNVFQLPTIVVAVEADADADTHGWHVRARHLGRLTHHRKSFGLHSVARREADALAAARGWRLAS